MKVDEQKINKDFKHFALYLVQIGPVVAEKWTLRAAGESALVLGFV